MPADYVIVGAGAAGCVLAERLSADPATSVVLLEAGGGDRHPLLHVPKGFAATIQRSRYTYHYPTEAVAPGGHGETWVRGRVVGGSTAINGMTYLRGQPEDYDTLARAGNPEWAWPAMRAAFLAIEDHELGASPLRGSGGPVPVSLPRSERVVTDAFLAAAETLGIPPVPDVNAESGERIGRTPTTVRRGRRVSAARAFLHPARWRPNLTVVHGARVSSLQFAGDRVVGVRAHRRGEAVEFDARREVLVAAGTVESPLLLERSGIGRPEVLADAGIELRVTSPHVGERVVEQRALPFKARLRPGLGLNPLLATPVGRIAAGLRYLLARSGPLATGPYELTAFLASRPGVDRPDIQALLTPLSTDESGLSIADHAGLMVEAYALRPTSRGAVHTAPDGDRTAPLVRPRFLQDAEERAVTGRIPERIRELLASRPLADLVEGEETPGEHLRTQQDAVDHALRAGGGIYHAVGSCAMGPREDDVVDSRLRVRGVPGLRVVDASVFPAMPSGGTSAPTMALAWHAAELVSEDR